LFVLAFDICRDQLNLIAAQRREIPTEISPHDRHVEVGQRKVEGGTWSS